MDPNQRIATYTGIFETLKKELRWKISNNQLLMAIAATYLTGDKSFDSKRFLFIADEIKKQSKPLSIWRSQSRFPIAALMDIHFDDAADRIPQLFHLYDQIVAAKFHRGAFTCIAAATLLVQGKNSQEEAEAVIARAKEVYQGMKQEHRFLTSSEDYPIAIALACQNRDDIMEEAAHQYDDLYRRGFRKGNDLQFLSHILALGSPYSAQPLTSNAATALDAMKDSGLKPKPSYYPFIGMLALLPDIQNHVHMVQVLYDKLKTQKHFKWQKDMNIMLATVLVVKEQLEDDTMVDTSLFTIIESILQAQQAALTAAAVSAAAAQNNSGSN